MLCEKVCTWKGTELCSVGSRSLQCRTQKVCSSCVMAWSCRHAKADTERNSTLEQWGPSKPAIMRSVTSTMDDQWESADRSAWWSGRRAGETEIGVRGGERGGSAPVSLAGE